jgi:glycosyltransferase involved in cell wall biosynthesis
MTSYLRAEPTVEGAVPFRRPLDILIMTSEVPPIVSGISTCIDRLATGLIARQHRVTVLSSPQIRRVAFGQWRLSSFVAQWPRIVRELRHFDVVNVHGPVPTMSDVFLWLSSRLPPYVRPAIVYTHHSPVDVLGATRIWSFYDKLHLALAQRADRIVASSPHHARQHRSRYGPVVRAIPWGADPHTWDRCVASYEGVLLEAARSRYARLHGLTTLPELDDSGPRRANSQPDAGLRNGSRLGPHPVPVPEVSASTAELGR